ncbi:MAG: hypothetical protein ABF508_09210 [Zymomonas mobilis]|uniref:hypothetical protein n=1 Tax=Zymomonas mobilis TaxID=542 RepID=UPI0039E9A8AD
MASYTDNRYFKLELLCRLEIIGINNVFLLSNDVCMQHKKIISGNQIIKGHNQEAGV